MVFFYTIRGGRCKNAHSHITLTSSDITCYVGRDKHENEYLIKYGWPGDIWFHVEGLSSAHVYFRLDCFGSGTNPNGNGNGSGSGSKNINPHVRNLLGRIPIDDLPDESVEDMCQIVKHNSISGCKMASCKIVYTPHSNLKKTFQMESGAVTYHDPKLQRFRRCDKDRQRIKALEKTKSDDLTVDYYQEMKANERGIIEWKRTLRKSAGAGNGNGNAIAIANANANEHAPVELYDPVLDDLRGVKARANQQGDESSGLDSGLAALEGLGLGLGGEAGSSPLRHPSASAGHHPIHGNGNGNGNEDAGLPVWEREANARLADPTTDNSDSVRFLLARGYTPEEIRCLDEETLGDHGLPRSVLLARAKTKKQGNDGSADHDVENDAEEGNNNDSDNDSDSDNDNELWSRIYESRNEEKDVLEAIYGEDDLARFGWKVAGDDSDKEGQVDDDDDDDDETPDPTRPFSFDCVLPVQGYEPPERYGCPPPLLLEIYADHKVSHYPWERPGKDTIEPPLLALVGGGLPQKYLRRLMDRLEERVSESCSERDPGEPMLFDWLQLAGELATEIMEEEETDIAEEARRLRVERAKRDRETAREAVEQQRLQQQQQDDASSFSTRSFRSDAERKAYAQSVLAQGLGGGMPSVVGGAGGDQGAANKKNYDAGADNLSLVKDLFG